MACFYLLGEVVERSVEKGVKALEKARDMGCMESFWRLAIIYSTEPKYLDNEKAVEHFLASMQKDEEAAKLSIRNIVEKRVIEWRKELHKFWKFPLLEWNEGVVKRKVGMNEIIATVLLCSKNRKQSKYSFFSSFVSGIAFKTIKFLCHFTQITQL